MTTLAFCRLSPDDATNGGALRFWTFCEQGQLPAFYAYHRERPESGMSERVLLPWASLEQRDFEDLVRLGKAYQESGGTLLVQELDFANRFVAAGVIPDIVDVIDSWSLYFERYFKCLPFANPVEKARAFAKIYQHRRRERQASRRPWAIVACAAADAARFSGGTAKVHALPNSSPWADLPPLYNHRERARSIGFHGTMTWEPNVSAAEYIVTKIFPLVRQRIPDANLAIFGGPIVPRLDALRKAPGVSIKGPVVDIREALSGVDVYLMPMLEGSGVKNKLMEAMSAALPVVTNPLGVEAFSGALGDAVAIGVGPEELALRAGDLLEDPASRLHVSNRARTVAQLLFSQKSLDESLSDIKSKAKLKKPCCQ